MSDNHISPSVLHSVTNMSTVYSMLYSGGATLSKLYSVPIGCKHGINVDPLLLPIPQVRWRHLLMASPFYIRLKHLFLFRVFTDHFIL